MKVFCFGALFGLLFSSIAIWFLKVSPWAIMPELRWDVFVVGGTILGGLLHQLIGSSQDVRTE